MEAFVATIVTLATTVGLKLLYALLVFIVGKAVVNWLLKLLEKAPFMGKLEGEVKTFLLSGIRITLYAVLVVAVVNILGIPMASVLTVLASAGVAVGLALQGALSNLAGGIMLMIFRPFRLNDYIDAAGVSGSVKEITLFYTVLVTPDNKQITIPNGSLMNANVTNYSAMDVRRVDLDFACGKGEDPAAVSQVMLKAMSACPLVLNDPAGPFARLSGGTNESMTFTARAWVKAADYWDAYFDLTQSITEALGAAGISAPSVRITENK